ncbi:MULTISPECIES: DUF6303 family protein [unclassified Streptomyces]|uniref:DUF6303 family protein n=1 Tax=unclassified Streptomyces TaxID=2593676 RepID=UPI000B50F38C|nr:MULTISPECIES: DUF6303 family protein [unclassified Streptomyces]MYX01979.1 hypothetical protein [Streptomyces sp. SID8378]SNB59644.1 hypothetical protein SAMN02745831_00095 [Streptomyces sp. PgraA7]
MSEHTAQLSSRDGRWLLYVVLMGVPVSQWPEHDFGPGDVPTPAERSRALTGLGFVFTAGAEWAWEEYPEQPDDDTSPVRLLASIKVRSRDGGLS